VQTEDWPRSDDFSISYSGMSGIEPQGAPRLRVRPCSSPFITCLWLVSIAAEFKTVLKGNDKSGSSRKARYDIWAEEEVVAIAAAQELSDDRAQPE